MSKRNHKEMPPELLNQRTEQIIHQVLNNNGKWIHMTKACPTREQRRAVFNRVTEMMELMGLVFECSPHRPGSRVSVSMSGDFTNSFKKNPKAYAVRVYDK